jgi:hypothetical protein
MLRSTAGAARTVKDAMRNVPWEGNAVGLSAAAVRAGGLWRL